MSKKYLLLYLVLLIAPLLTEAQISETQDFFFEESVDLQESRIAIMQWFLALTFLISFAVAALSLAMLLIKRSKVKKIMAGDSPEQKPKNSLMPPASYAGWVLYLPT